MTIDETVLQAVDILFESSDSAIEVETMPESKTKRGPGRPRLDPNGVQVPCAVKLTPEEMGFLRGYGGSVNGGLRKLVIEKMESMADSVATC